MLATKLNVGYLLLFDAFVYWMIHFTYLTNHPLRDASWIYAKHRSVTAQHLLHLEAITSAWIPFRINYHIIQFHLKICQFFQRRSLIPCQQPLMETTNAAIPILQPSHQPKTGSHNALCWLLSDRMRMCLSGQIFKTIYRCLMPTPSILSGDDLEKCDWENTKWVRECACSPFVCKYSCGVLIHADLTKHSWFVDYSKQLTWEKYRRGLCLFFLSFFFFAELQLKR